MRFRPILTVLVGFAVISCAGDGGDTADSDTMDSAIDVASPDDAALEAIRAGYEEHYNLRHASMVADFYADSALSLLADGSVNEGKETIMAGLEAAMVGSPTLSLTTGDQMVFRDWAISRGEYGVETTPEGAETISLGGNYMTVFARVDDEWKITFLVTNYNAPPPEGLPAAEGPAEAPPENGTMAQLLSAYEEHFNLGHASMVADLYTEDAFAALSNLSPAQGRSAIEAVMGERLAMMDSPQLTIHDVGTVEVADGWAVDGGWYELTGTTDEGTTTQTGSYMLLSRQTDDGSWKIHWLVSNGQSSVTM